MSAEVKASMVHLIGEKSSYTVGNNGLRIHLPVSPASEMGDGVFLACLHCQSERDGSYLFVYLRSAGGRYTRCHTDTLALKLQS